MSQQHSDQLAAARMARRVKSVWGAPALKMQLAELGVVADRFDNWRAADGRDEVPQVNLAELRTSVAFDSCTGAVLATRRSGKVDPSLVVALATGQKTGRAWHGLSVRLQKCSHTDLGEPTEAHVAVGPSWAPPARPGIAPDKEHPLKGFSCERLLYLMLGHKAHPPVWVLRPLPTPPSALVKAATRVRVRACRPNATEEEDELSAVWVEVGLWDKDGTLVKVAQHAHAYATDMSALLETEGSDFHLTRNEADPLCHLHVSVQLGWSKLGSATPFRLQSWGWDQPEHPGQRMYNGHVARWLPVMWQAVRRRYPKLAKKMKGAVGTFGLFGTGWNKVTLSRNCPTLTHTDTNNFGVTAVLAVSIEAKQEGGSHVVVSHDGTSAVVVEDSPYGVLIMGDYSKMWHGNLATHVGDRAILNGYCNSLVLGKGAVGA